MQMQGIMLVFVQVELYMAEMYNKIGTGLITWSPISLGLCSGKQEDQATLFTKLALKVGSLKVEISIKLCFTRAENMQKAVWTCLTSMMGGDLMKQP